ncbi:MAG: hypothetical protein H0U47_11165 [Nocardioidaceae bacterium]|nr:hypothetical protein [Nocardioidaceae bacterium]
MHAACLVRRAVHGFGLPQSVDESYRWLVEGVHHALTAIGHGGAGRRQRITHPTRGLTLGTVLY